MVNGTTKSSCTVFGPHNGSYNNSTAYMSTTKWNSCVVITADRHFLVHCVSYVYIALHSCADQEFFFGQVLM